MNPRRLSVAYFTNTEVRAGVEEHILTLLRGLDRRIFRPYLICPPALIELMRADIPADVETLPLNLVEPTQLGAAWRLARFLRAKRIDILHSHMFRSSHLASPVGWFCRVRLIVETAHGREDWRRGWLKSRFVVDRIVGRFVDVYIAVSSGCGAYLAERKGLPPAKIKVIPNGCDIGRFSEVTTPPVALKRALGFQDVDPVLVVVGRLEPQKGHAVLLQALVGVRAEFPNVRLVCVGDGDLRAALEKQAGALGLAESVRFVGYQHDAENWFALADVVVLPSFYEGMPLVAIEALAAGRAMVATAVDGTSEVVIHEKTGLTVTAGDPSALAGAICQLLRDPAKRRALGHAGKQWVRDHFSEEGQIQKTQQLYLSLLPRLRSLMIEDVDEDSSQPVTV
jgi:glycosyltransferase involved in cell wall biosynthesis